MGTRGKRVLKFQAECKESQIERAIMVTRPGSLMLLLAAGIVVIAALGSGTKHDPLPGANGMVDFLQADAVVTENTESSVNAVASTTCPFKNEDCCDETNIEARDTCLKSAARIVGIAALGSGTKHDPLPGSNGMVDFLQADAVVTEKTRRRRYPRKICTK